MTLLGEKASIPLGTKGWCPSEYKFSSPGANASLLVTANKNSPFQKKKETKTLIHSSFLQHPLLHILCRILIYILSTSTQKRVISKALWKNPRHKPDPGPEPGLAGELRRNVNSVPYFHDS